MRFIKRYLLLIAFTFIGLELMYAEEPPANTNLEIFSTRFCTVFYEKDVDLKKLNRNINLKFSDFYNPRRFGMSGDLSIEDIIAEKFDAVFDRVQEILDMRPSRIHVAVRICKAKDGLDKLYEEIFHEPNQAISFYVYKTNTIYTLEDALTERVLAHEMAHCIIDHYFVVLPPRKIQEMLAAYADVYLKE